MPWVPFVSQSVHGMPVYTTDSIDNVILNVDVWMYLLSCEDICTTCI